MTTPTVPPPTEAPEVPPADDPCISGVYGRVEYGTTRDGILPCDPDTGEVLDWPYTPTPNDCIPAETWSTYPGNTREDVVPCDPATGEILDMLPEQEAVMAERREPVPAQELPVTGAGETAVMLVVATVLVAAGSACRRIVRR